jgi:glutathione S-transferase
MYVPSTSLQFQFQSTEGGMELYCKAGPDGTAVGDCPFAHYVRLVLEEKGLDYEHKPTVAETKPIWLLEHYQGKLPALRHRKECYVDSDVICEYLDYFFPTTPLNVGTKQATEAAQDAVSGLFPAIAKYLKHTPDGDSEDTELLSALIEKLTHLEEYLLHKKNQKESGSSSELFMVGDQVTLQDCSLAPKLYHLQSGVEAFKKQIINIPVQYPAVQEYMDGFFARDSFQKTAYPKETVAWGWGNARK